MWCQLSSKRSIAVCVTPHRYAFQRLWRYDLNYGAIQICLLLWFFCFFWHSVDMFPREFKNWDIQNWVQIYQSVQSVFGKLLCNKTALKRCTSTETLWNRTAPSLSSPENEEIFLPSFPYQKVGMLTCSKVPRFQARLLLLLFDTCDTAGQLDSCKNQHNVFEQ